MFFSAYGVALLLELVEDVLEVFRIGVEASGDGERMSAKFEVNIVLSFIEVPGNREESGKERGFRDFGYLDFFRIKDVFLHVGRPVIAKGQGESEKENGEQASFHTSWQVVRI